MSPRSPASGFHLAGRPITRHPRPAGLTRHAASPDGIRVNAVCPGPTGTAFGGAIPSPQTKAARARKIPLDRMHEPEDIADVIVCLSSHAARMITGVALTVDGGVVVENDTPYEEYFRRG